MRCPHCNQQITSLGPSRRCPSCGGDVQLARQEATTLVILTGAFFVSILVYGFLVWTFEMSGREAPGIGEDFTYPAIALGVLCLGLMPIISRTLVQREGVPTIRQAALISMALAELPTVVGLTLYFLSGRIDQFVIMMGVSVVGFVYVATQIPSYIRLIERRKVEGG